MLVRRDFGPEGTTYVREYLDANHGFGKLLGRFLLASHDIDHGVAWAFSPARPPPERRAPLTDFETGGVFPKRDPAWAEQFNLWLNSARGKTAAPWLLCVEGALERPSDPFLDSYPDWPLFFCGDSVYTYANADSPESDVQRWLGGATWNPNVGIVTERSASLGPLTNRQLVSDAEIAELAARASAIVIGAWDDEGLMFWEPGGADE